MTESVREEQVEAARIVAIRRRVTFGEDALAPIIGELYDRLYAILGDDAWRQPGGNVIAYLPLENPTADMLVGRHWTGDAPQGTEAFDLPAGPAACLRHVGPYEGLPSAHQIIHSWMHQRGWREVGLNYEVYGDWTADPAERVTDVVYLLPSP